MEACLLCGSLSVAALLSLVLFGWEETAPEGVAENTGGGEGEGEGEGGIEQLLADATDDNETRRGGQGGGSVGRGKRKGERRKRRRPALSNPLSIIKVIFGNRCVRLSDVSFGCCQRCASFGGGVVLASSHRVVEYRGNTRTGQRSKDGFQRAMSLALPPAPPLAPSDCG